MLKGATDQTSAINALNQIRMELLTNTFYEVELALMIYRLLSRKGAARYLGVTDADTRRIWWDDELVGEPLVPPERWSAPLLKQHLARNAKPQAVLDCVMVGAHVGLSERAAAGLRPQLRESAQLYPVRLADADVPYYMLVVVAMANVLDRERSTGPRSVSNDALFATVDEWVMDEAALGSTSIFVLPDSSTTVYVTEAFKDEVLRLGLTGFSFKRKFWDEAPVET